MTTDPKTTFVDLASNVVDSMTALLRHWEAHNAELDDFGVSDYPFPASFDEFVLTASMWVERLHAEAGMPTAPQGRSTASDAGPTTASGDSALYLDRTRYEVEKASWAMLDCDGTLVQTVSRWGWEPIHSWGADGWDLGSPPYVLVFERNRRDQPHPFEVAYYTEGDVTRYAFPTEEARDAAIDVLALFHWRADGSKMRGQSVPSCRRRAPGWMLGRYSAAREGV